MLQQTRREALRRLATLPGLHTTPRKAPSPEQANAVRWQGDEARGHVESHFVKANSPDGRRALWIKHTLFVPRGRPADAMAELWCIAFDRERRGAFPVGAKVSVPIAQARWSAAPFEIETAGARLSMERDAHGEAVEHLRGEADDGSHRLSWSLQLAPLGPTFRPFPLEALYRGPFPRTKTVTPAPHARMRGTLEVDGEAWSVADWPGMQGHNWGRAHADAYVWLHGNSWDDDSDAWLEALSGRVTVGSTMSPWLSAAAVHVDGETVRFDGPGALFSRHVQVGFHRWRFELRRRDATLAGEVWCDAAEMAGLRYGNPDGRVTHCLNSKLARGRIVLRRAGRERVLHSNRLALEVGTFARDHGVRMLL